MGTGERRLLVVAIEVLFVAVGKEDGRLVVGFVDNNGVAIGKVECRVGSAGGMKVN